jgi:uncharacterized protein with PIN domain
MKFILSRELGRLCKWLRILGYDAVYFKGENKGGLFIEALRDTRILLTRNSRLPKRKGIRIVNIKSDRLEDQIDQLLRDLKIKLQEELMFSRCIVCNSELKEIAKDKVKDKVPAYVFDTQDDFVSCIVCRRIYWKGTHWGNVQSILHKIGV